MDPWIHIHNQLLADIQAKLEEIDNREVDTDSPALASAYLMAARQLKHALTCEKCRKALLQEVGERN